jgi:hypothetical protein
MSRGGTACRRVAVPCGIVPSSAIADSLFIERDASHADDGEAEISNSVKNPVQRRQISECAGDNGRVAHDLDP